MIQAQVRPGGLKSVAMADCPQCGDAHEFVVLINRKRNKE
jgi:hypothetical protein